MVFLEQNGKSEIKEISEALEIQYGAIWKRMRSLEKWGWVEKAELAPNKIQGQNPHLWQITEAGKERIGRERARRVEL